ncbi:TPA: exosporium protein D [Bacillus cereus]|nr:exosporium protein D [Bacillus cereus]
MANFFYKDGKKYYKKQSYSNHQKANCFIETHTISGSGANLTGNIPLNLLVPPNTSNLPVFEDFTNNHNKTLLQISSTPFSAFPALPLTIIIRTRRSNNPIVATLTTDEVGNLGGPRVFQVEDFESLSVSNTNQFQTGELNVFIQKTFCICCNDQSNSCDDYYPEDDQYC